MPAVHPRPLRRWLGAFAPAGTTCHCARPGRGYQRPGRSVWSTAWPRASTRRLASCAARILDWVGYLHCLPARWVQWWLACGVLLKIAYLLTCRMLGLAVLGFRSDRTKDAELLVLRHENAVLRRNAGRVQYEPGDRVWFAALARFLPRGRWSGIFPVTPATARLRSPRPIRPGGSGRPPGTWPASWTRIRSCRPSRGRSARRAACWPAGLAGWPRPGRSGTCSPPGRLLCGLGDYREQQKDCFWP